MKRQTDPDTHELLLKLERKSKILLSRGFTVDTQLTLTAHGRLLCRELSPKQFSFLQEATEEFAAGCDGFENIILLF